MEILKVPVISQGFIFPEGNTEGEEMTALSQTDCKWKEGRKGKLSHEGLTGTEVVADSKEGEVYFRGGTDWA